jgi:hypothetical protein
MRYLRIVLALPILFSVALAEPADQEAEKSEKDRAVYFLQSSVIGAGGAPGTSTNYCSNGTLGQPTPVGVGASTSFELYAGFWKKISIATGVLEGVVPEVFRNALFPNAPNPFNPMTTVRFEVAERAPVEVVIYGIQGRVIRTLVQETKSPGRYEIAWDGRDDRGGGVASGVYLCALRVGSYRAVKKMVLVK